MLGADKTEALIVTTVVKNISEKRQGILVTPVEVTEKNYMNQIIENIQKYSNISKFTVVHDYKFDFALSRNYQKTLEMIPNINLITSPSSIKMPSQLTASLAFQLGIKNISREFLLFWEHDHIFRDEIDWEVLEKCQEIGGKMIRFNRSQNPRIENLNYKDASIEITESIKISKSFLYSPTYNNGPFIADKDFCQNLWNNINFEIPSWNGTFGGFIEGPVSQKMIEDKFNLNIEEFKKKYPIYLYGSLNSQPIVAHIGDHKAIYKYKIYEILDNLLIYEPLRKIKSFMSNKIHTFLFKKS